MRILGLYAEDYPWDVRIEKVLDGLAASGHTVELVCRMEDNMQPESRIGGITCHRVHNCIPVASLRRLATVPAPFNPYWVRRFRERCDKFAPDVIVVRDIPLSPLALGIGGERGCPVVLDIAENHPAMWTNLRKYNPLSPSSFFMKNPQVARMIERRAIRRAAVIFVVVDEMRDRLISMGADPSIIHVVSNTPPLAKWPELTSTAGDDAQDPRSSELNLVYVGLMGRGRGLQTVVRAIALLATHGCEVRFHVFGSGAGLANIERTAREYGVADRVVFHGWVPNTDLPRILRRFDVGIVPHFINEHTNTTIPNKIFDYMASGIPSLVSGARPLRRVVEDNECGLAFDGSVESLALQIQALQDNSLRTRLGRNGRQAFVERFNWEIDFTRARVAIESLVGRESVRDV